MAKTSYSEKLLDPRWQKKRLEILQDNDFTCEICGDTESTLHVHHKMYAKGREPWEYETEQYAVLCKTCHSYQHQDEHDLFFEVMSRLYLDGPLSKQEIAIIVAGITKHEIELNTDFHKFLYFLGEKVVKNYWSYIDRKVEI